MSDAARIIQYSEWIRADADGLLYQLRGPIGPDQVSVLREAQINIKAALALVEHRLQNREKADVVTG